MKTLKIGLVGRMVAVLVVLGLAVFPLYWMFVTSLTSDSNLFTSSPQLFPNFSNIGIYIEAIDSRVLRWLLNSFIIAAGTCASTILLAIPFAYALARFRFKFKSLAVTGLFVTQMLPEALLVVPLFALFRNINLLDTLGGLILVNTAFVLPIAVFILRGAIEGVPFELEEAARVDGCSPLRILLQINTPLIAPTIAAASVIAFFNGWNEYVFAVTFTFNPALQPASVGLASFVGELSTPIQSVMTVGVVYALPAVVFYLFAQKYVVAGMTAGAVKG